MLAGVIGTVFAAAFTIGLIALILYVKAFRKVDKSHPDRKSQVRFNQRGFNAVLAFVGCIAVFFWILLLLAINIDLPSWVFSIGFVVAISAVRPVLIGKYGEMFEANVEGGSAKGSPVPSAGMDPQVQGTTTAVAGQYGAPEVPAQYGAPAAPTQYGAPAAPVQYTAPAAPVQYPADGSQGLDGGADAQGGPTR